MVIYLAKCCLPGELPGLPSVRWIFGYDKPVGSLQFLVHAEGRCRVNKSGGVICMGEARVFYSQHVMLSLLLNRHTSGHTASFGTCLGNVLGTSVQAGLSHENRAKSAWSSSLSCVPDGEGMNDSEDNTSKEYLPHESSSSISDGPGKEGRAAGWTFGPAKPNLNSWIEMIRSPALWQSTSIICTAFPLNLPHAKSPNLDIWYIFYQLKVHMCWGCSTAPVQDWGHQQSFAT